MASVRDYKNDGKRGGEASGGPKAFYRPSSLRRKLWTGSRECASWRENSIWEKEWIPPKIQYSINAPILRNVQGCII